MTSTPTVSRTKVDLSGLMKVLGEHLYSTPMVALRELVQNAHDSCHRRRLESGEPFEPCIVVRANPARKTLSIEDNGAGLTSDEIERYLATVGAGYTRTLRDSGVEAELIGYFGLGFLSAFVVAERVDVHTCSYAEPDRAWLFSSRAGQTYVIREAAARPVGTEVTLHLSDRFSELTDLAAIRPLLERYCCLLEFPVHCGPRGRVNDIVPPWRDAGQQGHSGLRQRKLALELAQRFEPRFAPLCYMDIEPDPGGASQGSQDSPCTGMIWIQDSSTYGTSDNRNVWVFVRGMMVTNEDRDLLPAWAGFAGALVESKVLVPTASRESLQKNEAYRRAQAQIHESLIHGLSRIARDEPASWHRMLVRHNEALLGAALCDDRLFELLAQDLTVPTSQGDLTLPKVLSLSDGKVHVSQSDEGGFEELLFRALKVPVVRGTRYAALPFCKLYTEKVRGTLVMLGTGKGDHVLFRPATLPDDQRDRLERWFAARDVKVVLARFEPSYLPLILVPDRDVELKRRMDSDEARRSISTAALTLARMYTDRIEEGALARLHVNLECPAIVALLDADERRRELGLELLRVFVALSTEPHRQAMFMEVDQALRRLSATIEAVLSNP